MTVAQKVIAVLGLAVLLVTLTCAPYEYTAHDVIAAIQDRSTTYRRGTIRAPFWETSPEFAVTQKLRAGPDTGAVWNIDEARLATDRLGLWWAAIAAVTLVAFIVAAPTRQKQEATTPAS